MKILTIVGARPQFIKSAMVSAVFKGDPFFEELIVHTGQHYDANMAQTFFDEMNIPDPWRNLGIGGLSHGAMTGRTLEAIENIIEEISPSVLLVYGDTNATLAGALAAVKLHIPVAHVEAGLRSYDQGMPEETNRRMVDHISTWLFCPTKKAVANLAKEGITKGVHMVGDVMYDASLKYAPSDEEFVKVLARFALEQKRYLLLTVHREANTDNPKRFGAIASAISTIAKNEQVVFPMHPRCKSVLKKIGGKKAFGNTIFIDPQPFTNMQALERGARIISTDSGGLQKEAYFHKVRCITLRDTTEWGETIETGMNVLVDADTSAIIEQAKNVEPVGELPLLFGDGHAGKAIVEQLKNDL